MLIYCIPLALAIAAVLLRVRALEHIALLYACAILLFRDGVGYDYENYVRIFEIDRSFFLAPLANILQDLARLLSIPNGFIGAVALLTTSLLLYLSRTSVSPRLSIIVFFAFPLFFLDSFTIVRQHLAVVVAAWSYQLLRQNKDLWSVVAYLVATGIHPSAAVSLPIFALVNPKLNWKYLVIAPLIFGVFIVVAKMFLSSNLAQFYAQTRLEGDYFIIVSGAALLVSIFFKDRELITCAAFGFLTAIAVVEFGNYALNRLIVFFYIPFLFAPLRSRLFRMPMHTLVTMTIISALFFAAFQVKLQEPRNGFIPYETIF